ncbi:hypothetical protein V1478_003711 [Vespula squamosa]|uniref:Uncharacterized protein n=1 Tax=Vespula squamosa TaxID=30214 RepID=A0ABD2BNV8_VESSQ
MGLNHVTAIVFSFVFVMLCASLPVEENIFTCDCNHCNVKSTIDPGEKEMTTIVPDEKTSEKKSNSSNGDETICARDRDFEDKTFSSVCHMLCYNKCTRFRIAPQKNTTRYITVIYRTNYYKLWNGPC